MHSRIYQIEKNEIDKEDYINETSYEHSQYCDFADYISDVDEEDYEDAVEWFKDSFSGIFKCEGRKLTLLDLTDFVEKWKDSIKQCANVIDMRSGMAMHDFNSLVNETHHRIRHRIDFMQNGYPDSAGSFILELFHYSKPGDVFYICGILDYHF